MIINLRLLVNENKGSCLLPFDYHYYLSSAIYRIIQKSDPSYNAFLHDLRTGAPGLKFTFSDLNVTFKAKGDRMLLLQKEALLTVCCHMPATTNHFINGLFFNESIILGDPISKVHFNVVSVEHYEPILPDPVKDMTTVTFRPCSPLVVGSKPHGTSKYLFHSPYELIFIDCLLYNWLEKYKASSTIDDLTLMAVTRKINIEVIFLNDDPHERVVTIKKGRKDEQKLRGYTKFNLKVTAPPEMIELALNTGLGLKNSLGMGCVKLIP
jgi:CRISPR-associated endoribonuclease Cas6